jgi:hypothetical protein
MASGRRDPYKNFNFRVLFGAAAMAGIVAAVGGSMLAVFKRRKVAHKEAGAGARPIEAVGTSTPGFVGTAPKQKKRRASKPTRPFAGILHVGNGSKEGPTLKMTGHWEALPEK